VIWAIIIVLILLQSQKAVIPTKAARSAAKWRDLIILRGRLSTPRFALRSG